MSEARQLALPFSHTAQYDAADFLADASNAEALAWLARTPDWPGGRLAIWGDEGRGKTHLLHAWAEQEHAAVGRHPARPGAAAALGRDRGR